MFLCDVLDETCEGRFERRRWINEFDYEWIRQDISVLCIRREAMDGAVEKNFNKVDVGGGWRQRILELLDVLRSVHKCYCVVSLYLLKAKNGIMWPCAMNGNISMFSFVSSIIHLQWRIRDRITEREKKNFFFI